MGLWVVVGAALAHVAQGGGAPPVVALVPVVLASTTGAWWAAARRLRFPTLLVLLGGSQVAVHLLAAYVHGHGMLPSAPMTLTHLASVALVAGAIARAERLWWSLCDLVTAPAGWHLLATPAGPAAPVAVGRRTREHGDLLTHAVRRRGPPAREAR